VRLPAHLYHEHLRYRRAEEKLRHRLSREPDRGELTRELELDAHQVERLAMTMKPLRSLDESVSEDGDTTLGDTIHDAAIDDDEPDGTDLERVRKVIARVLRSLDPRGRSILELRFGLRGNDELTLQQVGDRIGLSRERVRQIEAKALRQLADRTDVVELGSLFDLADDEAA
jgi:RNA polymerase sigma factor (sigma-70 family)